MKLRSSLLVACMVVVPALAMFSHLIPGDLRVGIRRYAASLVSVCLGRPAEAGPPAAKLPGSTGTGGAHEPATALAPSESPGPAAPLPQAVVASAVAPPPPAASSRATPRAGVSPGEPQGRPGGMAPTVGSATTEADDSATPALVAQLADRTRQARDQQARDLQAVGTQLAALGAVAFTCQPLPGPDGLFTSDCRVPVDPTGQLQRVFQASGRDPLSASLALVEQVTAFQQRSSQRPRDSGSLPPGTTAPPSAPVRSSVPDAMGRIVPNDGTR